MLKVIGAGFGRTGTSSLQAALEELGFGPCYHMTEVIKQPWHAQTWLAAAEGRPVDWEELFRNYQAAVDWPACEFYRELLAVYPEAKVLLSVRDPERWYESMANTIYAAEMARPFWFDWLGIYSRVERMAQTIIWGTRGRFGGCFEDRQYAIEIFNRHIEAVKQVVPAERLLVYEIKQGWEPLCEFLGVLVPPDKPFPHLNDTAQFRRVVNLLRLARWLGPLPLMGMAVAVLYSRWTRSRRQAGDSLL